MVGDKSVASTKPSGPTPLCDVERLIAGARGNIDDAGARHDPCHVQHGVGCTPQPRPDLRSMIVPALAGLLPLTARRKLEGLRRLLAHPDLRRTPRVSAFFDFVVEEIEAL
jgi:hypothetical protein